MSVQLLTEHDLEFLSLRGGYTCSSESTLVKMPNYWKSHGFKQLKLASNSFAYRYLGKNTTVDTLISVNNVLSLDTEACIL